MVLAGVGDWMPKEQTARIDMVGSVSERAADSDRLAAGTVPGAESESCSPVSAAELAPPQKSTNVCSH